MNTKTSRLATFLGSASVMTMAGSISAHAQQVAQAQMAQVAPIEIPEQVLITGSLIRGTAAVGVPVTNLSPQDFVATGALTTTDLFRTLPAANVQAGPLASTNAGNVERSVRVNLRGLDTGTAARNLFLIDGVRVPLMSNGVCIIDPSIIPALAQERIDVLVDGASATYGSDAISGVLNIILRRGYDGAVSQVRFTTGDGGERRYQASQLWGRTWDGGGITLTYEWHEDTPMMGNFHTQNTVDFTPWGIESNIPIGVSLPGTISTGAPAQPASLGLSTGTSADRGTNCTNCWAVPLGTGRDFNPINGGVGPTTPFSASTLNWAAFNVPGNTGTNGTRNVFNPYSIGWYSAAEQSNRAVVTVDQRLTSNISFYGEGYYSNRRSQFLNPPNISPQDRAAFTAAVPTWNPYYPTGGAPNNLRVSYTTAIERETLVSSWQVDGRYLLGLNIELPGDWAGKVYYSQTTTQSQNRYFETHKNAVSAALGWTIPAAAASGTGPGIATWTKPATVPYLNLFCDPYAFDCNSETTLDYARGFKQQTTKFGVNEKGANFDGPLFDLPAGQVKAAVGATYTTFPFLQTRLDNTTAQNLLIPILSDPRSRSLWATFTQVNVPVIGDANALPGVARFDLEGSWRHDQYSDFGGTSNAKAAFNWLVSQDIGLTIRGAWGESFRAPGYGETSRTAGFNITGWNTPPTIFQQSTVLRINCAAGVPVAGSGAAKAFNGVNGCNSQPTGIAVGGGSAGATASGLRDYVNQNQAILDPEKAMNYSLGFDLAPSSFLQGLDIQATWYSIKINGVITSAAQLSDAAFNSSTGGYQFIIPSDTGCPISANSAPTTCANFQNMVSRVLANPISVIPPSAQTLIYWVADIGAMNNGWLKVDGIDWNASYDWDWGGLGAFNTGITGTYYLHRTSVEVIGAEEQDALHTTIVVAGIPSQVGVENQPRFRYRSRLGWANGPWDATFFVNYRSHYFHNQAAPFNVNNQCTAVGGTVGGGTFPCLISNYTNITPPIYTFDLSLGFDTGDLPTNDFLKNIGIQVVVQNLFDRHPPFNYITGVRPGAWATGAQGGGSEVGGQGRFISMIVTKTW